MRAGRLRHRVTLQAATVAREASYGGAETSWSDWNTVWASVEPLRGREHFAAAQWNAETTHKVTLRYIDGVLPSMRVKFQDGASTRYFRIEAVKNWAERGRFIELMCVEILGA